MNEIWSDIIYLSWWKNDGFEIKYMQDFWEKEYKLQVSTSPPDLSCKPKFLTPVWN